MVGTSMGEKVVCVRVLKVNTQTSNLREFCREKSNVKLLWLRVPYLGQV